MATTIPITCSCGETVQAPAQYAGRSIACQVCGQALKVPGAKVAPAAPPKPAPAVAAAPPAPPAPRAATLDDLLRELRSIRFRLGVLVFVFVVLPLIGVGLWLAIMVLGALALSSRGS